MWILLCLNGMLPWNGSDGGVLTSFFLEQTAIFVPGEDFTSIIVLLASMEHGGLTVGPGVDGLAAL